MSIAFPQHDTNRRSLDDAAPRTEPTPRPKRPHRVSERQLAANRANARRSTGPRTVAGKVRSSRNATTHGLCRTHALAPGEDEATFAMFLNELEDELHPRTVLQRMLFPRIANLVWGLRRFADAQARLFEMEAQRFGDEAPLPRRGTAVAPVGAGSGDDGNAAAPPRVGGACGTDAGRRGGRRAPDALPRRGGDEGTQDHDDDADGAALPACEILARSFSDDRRASSPFARMNRYERSMESALLRLMREYHRLQKSHPTGSHAPDEPACPPERAWVHPLDQEATLAEIDARLAAQDAAEAARTKSDGSTDGSDADASNDPVTSSAPDAAPAPATSAASAPSSDPAPADVAAAAARKASMLRAMHLRTEAAEARSAEYRRALFISAQREWLRSRTNPSETPAAGSKTVKCSIVDDPPTTKRTRSGEGNDEIRNPTSE